MSLLNRVKFEHYKGDDFDSKISINWGVEEDGWKSIRLSYDANDKVIKDKFNNNRHSYLFLHLHLLKLHFHVTIKYKKVGRCYYGRNIPHITCGIKKN